MAWARRHRLYTWAPALRDRQREPECRGRSQSLRRTSWFVFSFFLLAKLGLTRTRPADRVKLLGRLPHAFGVEVGCERPGEFRVEPDHIHGHPVRGADPALILAQFDVGAGPAGAHAGIVAQSRLALEHTQVLAHIGEFLL